VTAKRLAKCALVSAIHLPLAGTKNRRILSGRGGFKVGYFIRSNVRACLMALAMRR
jgi:hypothetical protein